MTSTLSTQSSALISYPDNAAFGRVIPKNKIYAHSKTKAQLRELFVSQVEQITWAYKLAPETINLPAQLRVPEIQIFHVQLKGDEISDAVLQSIDKAVQFPLVFELHRGQASAYGQTKVIACYKRPSEADASRWVMSNYFATEWLPAQEKRAALPQALHMEGLYEQLLQRLIPLRSRPKEPLSCLIARMEQTLVKQRDIEKTQNKLMTERQFNRKVAINGELRRLKKELEEITQ